ncbi:MAG: DMT family transporter [Bacteroidales bacterium]|nr:DMT family transporter [Bacteroidales bacterium]
MQDQKKAYIFALLSVMFWSTMSTAFKLTLSYLAYDLLLFWSVWFAVIVLGIMVLIQRKTSYLGQTSSVEFGRSAIMGLLNPFGYYLVLFKAYELLQAQEAGVLNYTWPIVLVILSAVVLGQRIGLKGFVAIFISFSGLLIISTKGQIADLNFTNPTGVALAVGSAFLWALYWIINMYDKRDALTKIFVNMIFGAFYISIYMILFSEISFPAKEGLFGAIYIGVFEMGITFVFWLLALKYSTNTAKVSNLIFLSPFIALIFIRVFVGEIILPSTVAGLILIISGILLQQVKFGSIKKFIKNAT